MNDRIIKREKQINEVECSCGGTIYAAISNQFARCSSGATHCTRCLRKAHRINRTGWTCGPNCEVASA